MRAAILAVGSELLGTDRVDTNSLRLTQTLRDYGVELVGKAVVGDSLEELTHWVERYLERVDLLLISGGLGPTSDDLTRDAVAEALGRSTFEDTDIVADIEEKFARMGLEMPAVNRRQARVIEGARVLRNPRGTAPGLSLEHAGSTLFLFPGVPHEIDRMVESYLTEWLDTHQSGRRTESRSVRVACRSESAVEEVLRPLYLEFEPQAITVLASPGDIEVRFSATGDEDERRRLLSRMVGAARQHLESAIYSEEADGTLESIVGRCLTDLGRSVASAESCTAGLLAERLTRVPGSSAYFRGGVVTYADDLKLALLGVSEADLSTEGAVSESVARAMATGVRKRLASDYGIAITGIAGPDGGTPEKPVGTVHIAIQGPESDGRTSWHRRLQLPGDRARVRQLSSQWALDLLRRVLPSA